MKKTKKVTMASAALAMGIIIPQVMPTISHAEGNDSVVKLRLLETSDIHESLMNYDYYQTKQDDKVGLVQTAGLIHKSRSEVKNSMLFDDGDALQGTPLGDYMFNQFRSNNNQLSVVHPLYRLMNMLQYDVASLGNHEFNYGLDFLKVATAGSKAPVINSNVYYDDHDADDTNDKNYFQPYAIVDKKVVDENGKEQTIKVGVLGFVPPQIMNWDKDKLEGKIKTKDIVKTAQKFVPELKAKGADVIVALAHSGINDKGYIEGMENAVYYLSQVPGIDALMIGHSHDTKSEKINGVPVVMPGVFGSHLGTIDLQLKKSGDTWVVDKQASTTMLQPIADKAGKSLVTRDEKLVDEIKAEHQGTIDYVNKTVGTTTAPINSYFALVQDDPSVQIVTNAQKWYTEKKMKGTKYEGLPILSAGAPFKAGGRNGAAYYTDIPAGPLAIKNIADLYVYPNTLYAVKVNGAQVREWLEMSAGQFNQIDVNKKEEQSLINTNYRTYNFDILDGVTYQIDVTQPAKYDIDGNVVNGKASRIGDIMYKGKKITDAQEFIVATNNYRATSAAFPGVNKGEVVLRSPDENRQIIVDYIKETKTIDPKADNNWSLKPVYGKELNLTFQTGPAAQKYLSSTQGISYIGEGTDGFGKYAISLAGKPQAQVTVPVDETTHVATITADMLEALATGGEVTAVGNDLSDFSLDLTADQTDKLIEKHATLALTNEEASVRIAATNLTKGKSATLKLKGTGNDGAEAKRFLSKKYEVSVQQDGKEVNAFATPAALVLLGDKDEIKDEKNVKVFEMNKTGWDALATEYKDAKVRAEINRPGTYVVLESAKQTVAFGEEGVDAGATPTSGTTTTPVVQKPAGDTLPDTATNMFTMLGAGLLAMGAGVVAFVRRRKEQ